MELVTTAMLLVASSPGAPFGAKVAMIQRGDVLTGSTFQVLLAAVGSVTFPLTANVLVGASWEQLVSLVGWVTVRGLQVGWGRQDPGDGRPSRWRPSRGEAMVTPDRRSLATPTG